MKLKHLLILCLAALMALTLTASPAAAQGPDEGPGDVEAQFVAHAGFAWRPLAARVARGDGRVSTSLLVRGIQQASGLKLVVGYNASVVTPVEVKPGSLLPGTRNVDYFMTVTHGGGAAGCDPNGILPPGPPDSTFTVDIVYFDPTKSVNGSGDLIEVVWRSDPDAAVGDVGFVCLDGPPSLLTDNGFGTFPVPTVFSTITVDPFNVFKFRIDLQGGKNSGLVQNFTVPDPIFTKVTINGLYPCDGGGVDAIGYCSFNNATVTPPYTVRVGRTGYLNAEVVFNQAGSSGTVLLPAGDLNGDKQVNILDLYLSASLFGPVSINTLSRAADFTGPGNVPNGVVDIMDLVLVAKNIGKNGP